MSPTQRPSRGRIRATISFLFPYSCSEIDLEKCNICQGAQFFSQRPKIRSGLSGKKSWKELAALTYQISINERCRPMWIPTRNRSRFWRSQPPTILPRSPPTWKRESSPNRGKFFTSIRIIFWLHLPLSGLCSSFSDDADNHQHPVREEEKGEEEGVEGEGVVEVEGVEGEGVEGRGRLLVLASDGGIIQVGQLGLWVKKEKIYLQEPCNSR